MAELVTAITYKSYSAMLHGFSPAVFSSSFKNLGTDEDYCFQFALAIHLKGVSF